MTQDAPAAAPPAARVLIVDDHPVVCEGLAAQLATTDDLVLCGEAAESAEALAQVEATKPDVAIVDLSLRKGSGLELIKRLRAHFPDVRILVWSMYPEDLYAERALRAGALGYINKGKATHHVLEALRSVLQGRVYLSDDVSEKLLVRLVGGGSRLTDQSPIETLSDRELEAFELMGHGLTTPQIAVKMHISPKTVDTYRARIKEKLDLGSVSELVRRAAQWVMENS
jgi:DNA-binding NarL/FixJ family response regulator